MKFLKLRYLGKVWLCGRPPRPWSLKQQALLFLEVDNGRPPSPGITPAQNGDRQGWRRKHVEHSTGVRKAGLLMRLFYLILGPRGNPASSRYERSFGKVCVCKDFWCFTFTNDIASTCDGDAVRTFLLWGMFLFLGVGFARKMLIELICMGKRNEMSNDLI